MNVLVLVAEEEEENQVEEPQTTLKEPQQNNSRKPRIRKTYIGILNTRDTMSKRAIVCDNSYIAKRIKYIFYSNFILFKFTIFY